MGTRNHMVCFENIFYTILAAVEIEKPWSVTPHNWPTCIGNKLQIPIVRGVKKLR